MNDEIQKIASIKSNTKTINIHTYVYHKTYYSVYLFVIIGQIRVMDKHVYMNNNRKNFVKDDDSRLSDTSTIH